VKGAPVMGGELQRKRENGQAHRRHRARKRKKGASFHLLQEDVAEQGHLKRGNQGEKGAKPRFSEAKGGGRKSVFFQKGGHGAVPERRDWKRKKNWELLA